MNDEEEKLREVMESPPPTSTDELQPALVQQQLSQLPVTDETGGGKQCGSVRTAVDQPAIPSGVSSDEVKNVETGEEIDPAAPPSENRGGLISTAECSVAREELVVKDEVIVIQETFEADDKTEPLIVTADCSPVSKELLRSGGEEEIQSEGEKEAEEVTTMVENTTHGDDVKGGTVGERESGLRLEAEALLKEEVDANDGKSSPVRGDDVELIGGSDVQLEENECKSEAIIDHAGVHKVKKEQPDAVDSHKLVEGNYELNGVDDKPEEDNVREMEEENKAKLDEEKGEMLHEEADMRVEHVEDDKEVKADEETGMVAKKERDLMDEKDVFMMAEEETVEALDETELMEDKETEMEHEETMTLEESEREMEEEKEVDGGEDTEMEAGEEKEVDAEDDTELEAGEEQDVESELEGAEDQNVAAEETGMEEEKSGSSGGKRKVGRGSKALGKVAQKNSRGEDVCLICLDGGALVLCDRRGCPKAYHASCVDRDEAFFKSKGRWNCGWHLCSVCGKNAYYMCCTCTFSLCRGCIKDAVIFCVRGNKGLCETCMKTVKQIENNQASVETGQETSNDRTSWEYLFKDYWLEQKAKLSITMEEVEQAKNPWKGSDSNLKQKTQEEATGSESSLGNIEAINFKSKKSKKLSRSSDGMEGLPTPEASGTKRKGQRRSKSQAKEATQDSDNSSENLDKSAKKRKKGKRRHAKYNSSGSPVGSDDKSSMHENTEWASKELLEFVMHMKDGDISILSQYDVQKLLLEYIERTKLRDPRKKSQIVCDAMLQRLFGKPRVAHFEMLKLLESHFLLKEDADDNQGSVVDTEANQLDVGDNTEFVVDTGKNRGKKLRRKGHEKGLQSNLDDYAAIDMHNIGLIFLRRNLMEALMEDMESFDQKVVGSFVRIRIPGSNQKADVYRLVQVLGTTKAAEPYKVGKRTVDVMLEILNLDKKEMLLIDIISNQDFTEDECKRLRQSIKCGFISRLTVGDVLEKAKEYQSVRVADWLETETTRLNHLRDRASETGRKKELRECVERLQLLSTPEERQRRLQEIPEVHADPNMDPSHESEDESETEDRRPEFNSPRGSQFSRRMRDSFSSRRGDSGSTDPWSSNAKPTNRKWEPTRSLSGKGFSSRTVDPTSAGETSNGGAWSPQVEKVSPFSNSSERSRITPDSLRGRQVHYTEGRTNLSPRVMPENPQSLSAAAAAAALPTPVSQPDVTINEAEKQWQYKDPSGKTQGPFSVVQLRKWSKNGYFPANLRIWRKGRSEDDSILLTEALAGRFQTELSGSSVSAAKPYESPLPQQGYRSQVVKPNLAANNLYSDQLSPVARKPQTNISSLRNWGGAGPSGDPSNVSMHDSSTLPSTSSASTSVLPNVGRMRSESRWSGQPTPVQVSSAAPSHMQLNNGSLPSPTPESNRVSKFSNSPQGLSDKSRLNLQSATSGPGRDRGEESFGSSVHIQQLAPQSTASLASPIGQAPIMQHQVQPTSISGSIPPINTNAQVYSNNNIDMLQNPVSAQGWGSSGNYVATPEVMHQNMSNMNAMQVQVPQQQQQPGYGQWVNTAVNNQAAATQAMAQANYPGQTYVAPQNQWMPPQQNVPSLQQNMQWGANNMGMPAPIPENPGMPATTLMPGNPNMGWAPQPQPAAQYVAQPQQSNPAQMGPPTMQPGNSNMAWPMAGNMNQGWAAPPAGGMNQGGPNGGWNWQPPPPPPPQYGGGMVGGPSSGSKSQTLCPYLKRGCWKGASCEYRH